jgi:hypothetical protein
MGAIRQRRGGKVICGLAACVLLLTAGCVDDFYNNVSSLGGDTPGQRGEVQVMFVNNTPYRAIFTFGTYDPKNSNPDSPLAFDIEFSQYLVDANAANRLDPFTSSEASTFTCGRALSVGGEQLVDLIFEQELDGEANANALRPLPDESTGEANARAGIAFSDRPLDAEDADQPTAGWAEGVVTLQGAEYACDSLVVYTFEQDAAQPGGVRVDVTVILP